MGIGTIQVNQFFYLQPFGLFLYRISVSPHQRRQVRLKLYPPLLQAPVIGLSHVHIALGMRQYGNISRRLDFFHHAVQIHRGIEIGGFHQQVVAFRSQGEQVTVGEPLLEEVVEHVLGRQVQPEGSGIAGLKLPEAGAQAGRGIGDVLHDVGGTPDFADSQLLIQPQNFQGFFDGLYPVVHAGQEVGMVIGHSPKNPALRQRLSLPERPPTHAHCFFPSPP